MIESNATLNPSTTRWRVALVRLEALLLPLLVFLLMASLYVWRFKDVHSAWTIHDHFQWDAKHYFDVARGGYVVVPCDSDSGSLCGNAGWFPGLALVGALAMKLVQTHQHAAMLGASWLFSLASFYLLYLLARRRYGAGAARLALLSAATFPTAFYHVLAFPYALYTALSLSVAYALDRRWWWVAFFPALYLGATYPSGPLIVILAGWPVLRDFFSRNSDVSRPMLRARRWAMFGRSTVVVAAALGTLLFSLYCYKQFHDFLLYVHFQEKYGHAAGAIWQSLKDWLIPRWRQELPVTIMAVYAFLTVVAFFGRRIPTEWTLYGLAILLFTPAFGTFECYYRHIVPCWPIHMAIATSPAPRRVKVAWFLLGLVVGVLYLAPAFANGTLV